MMTGPPRATELTGPAGSADSETGRAGGAPQVEMNPAVQKVVHVESLSLTLVGAVNAEVIAQPLPVTAAPASRCAPGE
jgi:hypothetical protein